jgi:hypothetical protein
MAQSNGNIVRSSIMTCTCSHVYQDMKYGKQKRVHSRRVKGRSPLGWRCSVCGATKGE